MTSLKPGMRFSETPPPRSQNTRCHRMTQYRCFYITGAKFQFFSPYTSFTHSGRHFELLRPKKVGLEPQIQCFEVFRAI
jgi:hypothetical protein